MRNFVDQCNVSLPHAPHDQRWPMGFCLGVAGDRGRLALEYGLRTVAPASSPVIRAHAD